MTVRQLRENGHDDIAELLIQTVENGPGTTIFEIVEREDYEVNEHLNWSNTIQGGNFWDNVYENNIDYVRSEYSHLIPELKPVYAYESETVKLKETEFGLWKK